MNIIVNHPKLGSFIELELLPASNNREPGWSVMLPEGNSFFITFQNQQWIVRYNEAIDPELVSAIGDSLKSFQTKSGYPEAFKNNTLKQNKSVMYTIMGASGHVGTAIVRELTAQHLPVRAVVHQRDKAEPLKKLGAEVIFADTFELPSLITAFTGSKAVFLITPETGQNADLI
ncbi:MAG: hypothetical protein EOP45_09510, partial [Sphingobacteriaceae bacterium]